MTTIYLGEIRKLLAEIERLKLENAILKQALGLGVRLKPQPTEESEEVYVSAEEKRALLSGIS